MNNCTILFLIIFFLSYNSFSSYYVKHARITGFHLTESTRDHRAIEIIADEARVFSLVATTNLKNVTVKLYNYLTSPITIKAQRASFYQDSGKIQFWGNVKVYSDRNLNLTTKYLILRPEKMELSSQANTNIVIGDMSYYSNRFLFDFIDRKLILLGQVYSYSKRQKNFVAQNEAIKTVSVNYYPQLKVQ